MSSARDKLKRTPAVSELEKARLQAIAAKLGRSKDLSCKFVWPGGSAEIELRLLSVNDVRSAEADALEEVQQQIGDNHIPRNEAAEALAICKAKHLVARACFVPGTDERFFESASELGSIATEDELYSVYRMYEDHKSESDPDLAALSESQLDMIDGFIKKKASTSLKSIASDLPRSSLLIMVNRLLDCLQDKSTNT